MAPSAVLTYSTLASSSLRLVAFRLECKSAWSPRCSGAVRNLRTPWAWAIPSRGLSLWQGHFTKKIQVQEHNFPQYSGIDPQKPYVPCNPNYQYPDRKYSSKHGSMAGRSVVETRTAEAVRVPGCAGDLIAVTVGFGGNGWFSWPGENLSFLG